MAPVANEWPNKRLAEKLRESGDYAGHELALIR